MLKISGRFNLTGKGIISNFGVNPPNLLESSFSSNIASSFILNPSLVTLEIANSSFSSMTSGFDSLQDPVLETNSSFSSTTSGLTNVGQPEIQIDEEDLYSQANIVIFAFDPVEQGQQTLFQSRNGTTPVTTAGQNVASIRDFRNGNLVAENIFTSGVTWLGSGLGLNFELDRRIDINFSAPFVGVMVLATNYGTYPLEVSINQGDFFYGYFSDNFNYLPTPSTQAILFYPDKELGDFINEEMTALFERGSGIINAIQTKNDFSNEWRLPWGGTGSLLKFPAIEFIDGVNFGSAWRGNSSMTFFGQISVQNGENFSNAWNGCSSLQSFPLINMQSATNLESAWNNCSSLQSFPLINVSNVTTFRGAWRSCSSLQSFPLIDVQSATNLSSAWRGCSSLQSFPQMNFPSVSLSSRTTFDQGLRDAWRDCINLVDFPPNVFNNCPTRNYTDAFVNCALSQQSVDNILVSLVASDVTTGGISITGGTNSPPSATGLAARTTLINRGWIVNVNS